MIPSICAIILLSIFPLASGSPYAISPNYVKGGIDLEPSSSRLQAPSADGPAIITLEEPITLRKGGMARLATTDGFTLTLTSVESIACLKQGSCPPSAAHLEMRPRDGVPRLWTLAQGHDHGFGNYKVRAAGIDTRANAATIIVERTGATSLGVQIEPTTIREGSPFQLRLYQAGYIDGVITITLRNISSEGCGTRAAPSDDGAGCVPLHKASVRIKGRDDTSAPYILTAGKPMRVSHQFYLTFTKAMDTETGSFILNQTSQPKPTDRVQLQAGTPIRMRAGETGFILGTQGFEFMVTNIDPGTCTANNGEDLACKPGTVNINSGGSIIALTSGSGGPGRSATINDRYILSANAIYGMANEDRMAELTAKDTYSDIIAIKEGIPFELVATQKGTSEIEPGYSITLLGFSPLPCIRRPCPYQADIRIETQDRGDFEASIAAGMTDTRAGVTVTAEKIDAATKRARLSSKRAGQTRPKTADELKISMTGGAQTSEQSSLPPSKPKIITETMPCGGCLSRTTCLPVGDRITDPTLNLPAYCGADLEMSLQKKTGETCEEEFECLSGTCTERRCAAGAADGTQQNTSGGFISRIVSFFRGLFGL